MGRLANGFLFCTVMTVASADAAAQPMSEGCAPKADAAGELVMVLDLVSRADDLDGHFVTAIPGSKRCAVTPVSSANISTTFEKAAAAGRTDVPESKQTIVYVPGINTTRQTLCDTVHMIRMTTGHAVVGIVNETRGMAADLLEVDAQRDAIASHTDLRGLREDDSLDRPVMTLRRLILSEVFRDKALDLWSHSQGGAITSLALYEAKRTLTPMGESLGAVRVTTFAGAAPHWPEGPTYAHYIHTLDLVPVSVGLGARGWRDERNAGGKGASVHRFGDGKLGARQAGVPKVSERHDVLAIYFKEWKSVNEPRPSLPGIPQTRSRIVVPY